MDRDTSCMRTIGALFGLVLAIGIAINLPDVVKYIKLKTM